MTTITNSITTTGVGLYGSNTRQAAFLRTAPGYLPDIDPRLPKHDILAEWRTAGGLPEIIVTNIGYYSDPSDITASARSTVQVRTDGNVMLLTLSSVNSLTVGLSVATAQIAFSQNVKIFRVYTANSSVLLRGFGNDGTVVSSGETVYFSPKTQVGALRVNGEVIFYDRLWAANSALTGLTRGVGTTNTETHTAGAVISVLGLRTVTS